MNILELYFFCKVISSNPETNIESLVVKIIIFSNCFDNSHPIQLEIAYPFVLHMYGVNNDILYS